MPPPAARFHFKGRVPLFSLRKTNVGQRYQIGDRASTESQKQIGSEMCPSNVVRSDNVVRSKIAFAIKDASDPLLLWPTCLISSVGAMETFGGAMLQYPLEQLKPRPPPPRPLVSPRWLLRSSFAPPSAILNEQILMRSLLTWLLIAFELVLEAEIQ